MCFYIEIKINFVLDFDIFNALHRDVYYDAKSSTLWRDH